MPEIHRLDTGQVCSNINKTDIEFPCDTVPYLEYRISISNPLGLRTEYIFMCYLKHARECFRRRLISDKTRTASVFK